MHGGGSRASKIEVQILQWQPDIVALAEFRGTAPSKSTAKRLLEAGYCHQLTTVDADHPSWNALLLASRYKLTSVKLKGAPEPDLYWLLAQAHAKNPFHIGVVHAPWSIYIGRLEYYDALLNVAKNWQYGPGVIIGDMNSGINGLDEETENSLDYDKTVMNPLESAGWRDPFRVFHPDVDAPTWYSPQQNGFRLDQAFVNDKLQAHVNSCDYDWGSVGERGKVSDHTALLLDFKFPG
ncbi:MAG: hypothetical protein OXG60_08645 [Chloroflexi bacterium]|nr:hypothetical protein [Chloroflexota bacterium]